MRIHPPNHRSHAFTRLDLAAAIAATALLAALVVPSLAATSRTSNSMICADNLRRLIAAWTLYANENQGRLISNAEGGRAASPMPYSNPPYWAVGWLNWDTSADNTNTAYLIDPRYGGLSDHINADASLFRCPEDTYLSAAQVNGGFPWRARSYSMNYYLGNPSGSWFGTGFARFYKFSDFKTLAPGKAFVFVEEHPDSINDPVFVQDPLSSMSVDLPWAPHERGSWFAFADGHLERRTWSHPALFAPVRFASVPSPLLPNNTPDFAWLTEHATEPR